MQHLVTALNVLRKSERFAGWLQSIRPKPTAVHIGRMPLTAGVHNVLSTRPYTAIRRGFLCGHPPGCGRQGQQLESHRIEDLH